MAAVPYQAYPSVEPAASPPDDYQRIPVNPGQFGAQIGQGLEAVGAGASKAAKYYAGIAADQATNNYETESNKLLFGDPNDPNDRGFYGLRGQDALDAMKPTQQKLLQLRQQISGGLYTGEQRNLFEGQTRRQQMAMLGEMGRHYDQQLNTWADTTNKAAFNNAIAKIASRPEDDTNYEAATHDAMRALFRGLQAQGGENNSELVEQSLRTARQAAASARIEALLPTNPQRAQQVIEQESEILKGPLYDQLSSKARAGLGNALGAQIFQRASGEVPATSGGMAVGGAIPSRIAQEAQAQGVSPPTALATAHIESGMGRNLGSRGNIFQLGQTEWASVGGGRMGEPATDIRNGVAFLGRTEQQLGERLGRTPEPWETYLAHQQGVAGATALLGHPETPAGALVGANAISANGGDPNAPASAFVAKWRGAFNHNLALYSGGSGDSGGSVSPVAIGDSIAAHMIRKAGVGGQESGKVGQFNSGDTAVSGYGPADVLRVITATPAANVQDRNIILSTGASNNPAQIDQVASQIQILKSRGASNVTLLGVGTAPQLAGVNDKLAQIARDNGAGFAGPLVKVAADGIHSSDPKAVLQQARAANVPVSKAPPAGDRRVDEFTNPGLSAEINAAPASGEPIPLDNSSEPAGVPSADQQLPTRPAPAQPPGLPAPGVADIAAAQQIADQQYAHKLERIGADPAAAANPIAFDHATKLAENEYRRKTVILTGQMKAITEARNAAATGYVREAMQPGGAPPDLIDRMAADKRLDAPTLENLWRLVEAHQKHTVAGDLLAYGPKYSEAYAALTLPDSDPNKIRDPSQIIAMGNARPDGNYDLTGPGVHQLIQDLDHLQKRDPRLAEKKKELMQLVMPMDRASEEYSQEQRQQRYDFNLDIDRRIGQKQQAHQDPFDLFDPAKPDYLGKPYLEQIAARQMAQTLQGDPGMKTQEGVAALYRANKITREQAAEALTRLGIKFSDPTLTPAAPPPAALVPPMAR